jgi:hypothetical protein
MKQTTFASLSYDAKKKQTRRERFLLEMVQVVPSEALLAVVEPFYPQSGQPRASADALEHDAADSLFATVVRSV